MANIAVVDEAGAFVPGAEVFVNGKVRARTDPAGQAFVEVATGDTLVARKLVHEEETPRGGHDRGSSQNWNYRVYITSLSVDHDENGDNVRAVANVVSNPDDAYDLQLRRRNTLIAFNLRCSIEWDASSEMMAFSEGLREASELLYNGTDGQFLIEQVELADDKLYWDEADIHVYAKYRQKGTTKHGGLWRDDEYTRLNPYDGQWPETHQHELGHYALDLRDEYKEGDGWEDENGDVRCTLASGTSDPEYGEGSRKHSCFLTGNQGDIKKLCSSHPDNPHAGGTEQGDTDCWTTVVRRYADSLQRWRLLTPPSRGAIPDRFPDSGIPLNRRTRRLNGAVVVESYIPLVDWKPRIYNLRRARAGLCDPFLRARCLFEGDPVDGVTVRVQTTYGRMINAGITEAVNFRDNTFTGHGEVLIRGAHVGDRLLAMRDSTEPLFFRIHIVTEADRQAGSVIIRGWAEDQPSTPLGIAIRPEAIGTVQVTINTARVLAQDPIGFHYSSSEEEPTFLNFARVGTQEYVARVAGLPTDFDRTFTATTQEVDGSSQTRMLDVAGVLVDVDDLTSVYSPDGQLHVVVRRHSLTPPAQLLCWNVPLPSHRQDRSVVVGPYALALTGDQTLTHPVNLSFQLDDLDLRRGAKDRELAVVRRRGDDEDWHLMESQRGRGTIRARTVQLGTFAVVSQRR